MPRRLFWPRYLWFPSLMTLLSGITLVGLLLYPPPAQRFQVLQDSADQVHRDLKILFGVILVLGVVSLCYFVRMVRRNSSDWHLAWGFNPSPALRRLRHLTRHGRRQYGERVRAFSNEHGTGLVTYPTMVTRVLDFIGGLLTDTYDRSGSLTLPTANGYEVFIIHWDRPLVLYSCSTIRPTESDARLARILGLDGATADQIARAIAVLNQPHATRKPPRH